MCLLVIQPIAVSLTLLLLYFTMFNSTFLEPDHHLHLHDHYYRSTSTAAAAYNHPIVMDNFDFEIPENYEEMMKTYLGYCCSDDPHLLSEKIIETSGVTNSGEAGSSSGNLKCKSEDEKRSKRDSVFRVAFRTKSTIEVMDDGFKWRKYGKKKVKNSPNPRNYYRCASQGCQLKKRVERDSKDPSYVITTYEGTHNHQSPCVVYYNETPLLVPTGWTLQSSHDSS